MDTLDKHNKSFISEVEILNNGSFAVPSEQGLKCETEVDLFSK